MSSQNKKSSHKDQTYNPSVDQRLIIKIFAWLMLGVNLYVFYPIIALLLFRSDSSITGLILYSAVAFTPLAVVDMAFLGLYLLVNRPKGIKMFLAWLGILLCVLHLLLLMR